MGECPDWYSHMQVAKYLGIDPERLSDLPLYWKHKALVAMSEEAEAQKSIDQHNALKAR